MFDGGHFPAPFWDFDSIAHQHEAPMDAERAGRKTGGPFFTHTAVNRSTGRAVL